METHEGKIDENLFWVISIPNRALGSHGFEELRTRVKQLSNCAQKFDIPNLRVGTLDSLMSLSDELVKKDQFLEVTTKKIARQLVDLFVNEASNNEQIKKSAGKPEKIQLLVNGGRSSRPFSYQFHLIFVFVCEQRLIPSPYLLLPFFSPSSCFTLFIVFEC